MNAFYKLYATVSAVEGRLEERYSPENLDERGVTAIEYALMAGGIAVIVGAGMTVLRTKIEGLFGNISV